MTSQNNGTDTERTELIQRGYKLTGDILRTEKTLYELRQAQVGLAISLYTRFNMSVTDAATICGMPRQRLSAELRIKRLRDDTGSPE